MLFQPTTYPTDMPSTQTYHNHAGVYNVDSNSMAGFVNNNLAAQWYAPNSYAFDTSYMTPCPSTGVDSQPWTQLARASVPDISMAQFGFQHHVAPIQPYHDSFKHSTRPRSSPSTFGPTSESIQWPMTNGLGIYSSGAVGQLTPVTSTFPPNVLQSYAADDQYLKNATFKDDQISREGANGVASMTPEIKEPQPRRPYANIQPDPAGIEAQKRKRDDNESEDQTLSTKRRKRTSSVASADLGEDDRLLVKLKEEENLPWKDIASRYSAEKGKTVQVAALQMKYKRLREKYRVWTEPDLSALKQAFDVWEKRKWEIISEKMLDFGVEERWNPKHCARKWQELEMAAVTMVTTAGITPAMSHLSTSQFSSPIEAPAHFSWLPLS